MATVSRSLSLSFQSGILGAVLLQSDFASDPVTMQVFYTDDEGNETLAAQGTAQIASAVGANGNRLALLADIPAAQSFRVVADNGVSGDALDMELIYGAGAPLALSQTVVFVQHQAVTRSPAVAPADTRDVTVGSNAGAVLSSVIQNPASVLGTTNRVFSQTTLGVLYLVAQADLPAPGGIARRGAVLAKTPGGQFYRCTTQGDVAATVGTKYGVIDSFYLQDSPGGSPTQPGTSTFPESVTWVALNGNNLTAQRGNPSLPFATVQAAVDASNPGDTLMISPGSYGDAIVAPDFDLSIIGQGNRNKCALGVITWNPTGASLLYLASVEFAGGTVSGNGASNDALLRLDDVALSGVLDVEFLDLVLFDRVQGIANIENCNGGTWRDVTLSGSVNVDEPVPGAVTLGPLRVFDSRIVGVNGLQVDGNAQVEIDGGTCTAVSLGTVGGATVEALCSLRMRSKCDLLGLSTLASNTIVIQGSTVGDIYCIHAGPDPLLIQAETAKVSNAALEASGLGSVVIDTRGGNIDVGGISFIGSVFWRRLTGAGIITLVPGSAAYTFASAGGAIPGAPFPPADLVAYVLQAVTDPILVTLQSSAGFTANNTGAAPQDAAVVYSYIN